MIIFHGNFTTEYGMTPGGCFTEKHSNGKFGYVRATKECERFLRWIIATEVNKDIERRRREQLVQLIARWWTEAEEGKRYGGSFNKDQYFKYIQAKIDNGSLQW